MPIESDTARLNAPSSTPSGEPTFQSHHDPSASVSSYDAILAMALQVAHTEVDPMTIVPSSQTRSNSVTSTTTNSDQGSSMHTLDGYPSKCTFSGSTLASSHRPSATGIDCSVRLVGPQEGYKAQDDTSHHAGQKRQRPLPPVPWKRENFNPDHPIVHTEDLEIIKACERYELMSMYRELREEGIDVPYAPFEPEYMFEPYRTKRQKIALQLLMLAIYILWFIGMGAWLAYRIWGMYVGYSTAWHNTNIHNDFRFDVKMWRLYRYSLIAFSTAYYVVTFCSALLSAIWWKDIIVLSCLRLFEGWEMLGRYGLGEDRKENMNGEKLQDKSLGYWDWDFEWEEKVMMKYANRIWWTIVGCFSAYPLMLCIAWGAVQGMQGKCTLHDEEDPNLTFGY